MTKRALDICFVLPSLEVGGAERVVVNLANGLLEQGHSPRLLLTDRGGPLREGLADTIPVTTLGHPRVRRALPALIRELHRSPADVVLSTHTHVNLLLCASRPLLARSTRLVLREPLHAATPFVDVQPWVRRMQRILYPRADLLLATSEPMRADLASLTGMAPLLLPNAVDVRGIRDVAAQGLSDETPDRPDRGTSRRFVAVGRLTPQKGFDDLLDAFAVGSDSSDRLDVFGDGPLRGRLERRIDELGIGDRVRLAGNHPALWAHVARAETLVLASTHEGMPNAALESLALGTPVLATTDLDVLEDLRRTSASGAVTLVPRSRLASAMSAVRRRDTTPNGRLAPSLLPAEFDSESVSRTLATVLTDLTATAPGGSA